MSELIAIVVNESVPRVVNLNDYVTVRLTEYGSKLVEKHYADVGMTALDKEKEMGVDIKYQLWELMQIFGPGIGMGMKVPFTPNHIVLENNDPPGPLEPPFTFRLTK